MQYRRKLDDTSKQFKSDIYASKAYKNVKESTKKFGFTTSMLWCDGLQVSKAKQNTITPVARVINEMSPIDRFKHENIILEMLWCSKDPVNYSAMFSTQIADWKTLREGKTIHVNDKKLLLKHDTLGYILDYVEACKVHYYQYLTE